MKTFVISAALLAATSLAGAGAALAATSASATTDLNIRSGPGPQYPPVGVIPNGDHVAVLGCIQGSQWCQVDYNGKNGWSYGQYLTTDYQGKTVVIEKSRAEVGVPVVTYQAPADAPAEVPVHGELIGRVGDVPPPPAITPPPTVQTYVMDNRVDPVYLNGEVVVGAGIPDTVNLVQVPDYKYDYVYVNGEPVLVDPDSRRIVYVYR
ncbi:MAG: DUF1236 domain-containing protein [Pararhizobium sp.]